MIKRPEFLKGVKEAYFIGIKGVGMTALACCFDDLGIKVRGSDVEEIFVTDKALSKRKINWEIGFDKEGFKTRPDLVIATGAHGGMQNPQVRLAQKEGIPVLTHAEALGKLMKGKQGISVCGVGGKTTTAAILSTVLSLAGRNPSFAVGVASLDPLGCPGRFSEGELFVAEADEYVNSPGIDNRPRFSFQKPKVIIVTNIEYDHPDVYKDLNHTLKAYRDFFENLPSDGLLLACLDNSNVVKLIRQLKVNCQTYGFSPEADWRVEKVDFGEKKVVFNLSYKGALIEEISLQVPGKFNVLNSAAAFAAATFFGVDAKTIKKGLAEFKGTKRRFEFIRKVNGIDLYDDYAHHPEEIRATLSAVRQWFPKRRVMTIFQPHTYSRTKALLADFARCFSLSKVVLITDIYASAREKNDPSVSGRLLAEETLKFHPKAIYTPGKKEVVQFLKTEAKEGDVVLTMGAGNIFSWHPDILKALKERRKEK